MATRMFSARMSAKTLDRLVAFARRNREPRSRLAERLIEEGLRMQVHPGIEFRDGPSGRRASVRGGADVWELASVIKSVQERGGDVIEESCGLTGHHPHQIRAAVGYYAEYRDEIDERIRRNAELAEEAEAAWLREQALLGR